MAGFGIFRTYQKASMVALAILAMLAFFVLPPLLQYGGQAATVADSPVAKWSGGELREKGLDRAVTMKLVLNRFLAEFEQNAWPGRDHLDDLLETAEERTLVASLLFETPKIDDPVKVVNFGLALIQSRSLEPRVRQIELALANTASDSNVDANSLFKELLDIKRQLRAPLRLPAA